MQEVLQRRGHGLERRGPINGAARRVQEVFEHRGCGLDGHLEPEAPSAPTAANEAIAAPARLSIAGSQPTRGRQTLLPADVEEIAKRPATTHVTSSAPSMDAATGLTGFRSRVRLVPTWAV